VDEVRGAAENTAGLAADSNIGGTIETLPGATTAGGLLFCEAD